MIWTVTKHALKVCELLEGIWKERIIGHMKANSSRDKSSELCIFLWHLFFREVKYSR